MQPITTELEDRVVKAIEAGIPALDIIHGEMKVYMLEAELELYKIQDKEETSGKAIDSMERRYWEGQLDALAHVYGLTYQLSFAIMEQNNKKGK